MPATAVRFTGMYTQITTPIDAGTLHERLYAGEIFLFRDLPAMRSLVAFAQGLLERAFDPHAPPVIHSQVAGERQAEIFAAAGKEFTRSPALKSLWREVFESVGLDAERLARDRLRLRFQPPLEKERALSRSVMRSTVPFHRDTWGTNLYAQVNWWAPVYPITEERTMALYPALWGRALRNSSASYDLQALVRASRWRHARSGFPTSSPGRARRMSMAPRAGWHLAFSIA
jgi:hypothetical protein